MIDEILKLYREHFPFIRFYDNLLYNITHWPEFHIQSDTFLKGYKRETAVNEFAGRIITESGDIRVDLPVWFGDPASTNRIVVIGLEPRDTDKEGILNIERDGRYVFATPFALERPRGPYYSAFFGATQNLTSFIYFTDVVKTYDVSGSKRHDDKVARKEFNQKAQIEKEFLLKELDIIKPDKVIALGNESHRFLTNHLSGKYEVLKVRHPSQGGAIFARQQFLDIVQRSGLHSA